MNKNDLERHMKIRLGSTLAGASKEIKNVFGAKGMFSIKKKQKANLFSLSLRTNLNQDIQSGRITTIEEIDQIIDQAILTKKMYLSKTGEDFKMNSATFDVVLPVLEKVSHSGKTKAVATLGFGIVGWALASGSKSQYKTVKRIHVTLHENGFQIHKSAPDGSNLRIEWDNLIVAKKQGKNIILDLKDGSQISLKANIHVLNEIIEQYVTSFNENARGRVDSGWD